MKIASLTAMVGAIVLALGLAGPAPAQAAEKKCPQVEGVADGTVTGRMTTVGFIIGARWGEGTLTLGAMEHSFSMEGAKLFEAGISEIEFTGSVYNLSKLEDFSGDYGSISQGITLVKGITGSGMLSNENCVYLNLDFSSTGLKLSAPAPEGILITLD